MTGPFTEEFSVQWTPRGGVTCHASHLLWPWPFPVGVLQGLPEDSDSVGLVLTGHWASHLEFLTQLG